MADQNWSLTGVATKAVRSGIETGAIANINDDNTGTMHGAGDTAPPFWGSGTIDLDHIVTFAQSVDVINKAEILVSGTGQGGGVRVQLYLYYSGTYNLVLDQTIISPTVWTNQLLTVSGTWNNVTKIKAVLTGACGGVPVPTQVYLYDYELRAWGPAGPAPGVYDEVSISEYVNLDIFAPGIHAQDDIAVNELVFLELVTPGVPTLPLEGRVGCLGDGSSHGGTITSTNTDGKGFLGGAEIAVSGALHSCPIEGHGVTPITPVVSRTYYNGKLVITAFSVAGCGAIILPAIARRCLVEG